MGMNGAGSVVTESATESGLVKRIVNKASAVTSKSFNYLADSRNATVIIRNLIGAGTFIAGIDYAFAEANQKTSYVYRALESSSNSTYSPDPDTRSKAAALRRRGIDLSDCCEPKSRRLNPELVENKYEAFRPYETKRYLTLEGEKIALEEKAKALEEENRKLRLNLEGPSLE